MKVTLRLVTVLLFLTLVLSAFAYTAYDRYRLGVALNQAEDKTDGLILQRDLVNYRKAHPFKKGGSP